MDRYEEQGRIGQGAYGVVLRARHKQSGRIVAIKKMSLTRDRLVILRELCTLRNLHHENILTLVDCFSSLDTLSLVTEFVTFHLNDIILDPRRPKNEEFICFFYHQILLGVEHMHSVNIMHRDLKPENILVTAKMSIRIADFGQACLYFPEDHSKEYEENVATRYYRAPELLFGSRKYTPTVDVWALGCVLSEFLNGYPLFQGRNDIEQISKIFQFLGTPSETSWPGWHELPDANKLTFDPQVPVQDWSLFVRGASPVFLSFLQCHLRLDGHDRLTASRLLAHSFLEGPPRSRPPYRLLKRHRSNIRRLPMLARR